MDLLELFISASMVPINFSAQLKNFIETMAAALFVGKHHYVCHYLDFPTSHGNPSRVLSMDIRFGSKFHADTATGHNCPKLIPNTACRTGLATTCFVAVTCMRKVPWFICALA